MGDAIYTAAERAALATPFSDVMPPLSSEAYANLKSEIEQNGLIKSILIDESRNIIDGHHRYRICTELDIEIRTETCRALGDDQDKRLRIIALNLSERQLSSADRKRLSAEQKRAALKMLAEGRGVRETARVVGRALATVQNWRDTQGDQSGHTAQPTATTAKLAPSTSNKKKKVAMTLGEQKEQALKLVGAGVRDSEIASTIGVHRDTVKKWREAPESDAVAPNGGGTPRAFSDEEVTRLFNEGLSREEIAKQLNASYGTVLAYLKRLGLSRAGKRAKDPIGEHRSRAEAEEEVWRLGAETILALAKMATREQISGLTAALGNLAKTAATLKNRLNKEAGKDE